MTLTAKKVAYNFEKGFIKTTDHQPTNYLLLTHRRTDHLPYQFM